MMKEIYAMCNRKKMHIGTVKYFSDNGEEFCLIDSTYRFSQVCCKEDLERTLKEMNPNYEIA